MKKLLIAIAAIAVGALAWAQTPDSRPEGAPEGAPEDLEGIAQEVADSSEVAAQHAAAALEAAIAVASDSIRGVYTRAAQGEAEAQNEVGNWYFRGRHVEQDYRLAAQWWLRAARQGHSRATGNLGLCYKMGYGVDPDSVRATRLILKSINDGNNELEQMCETAAEQGDVFCNSLLAWRMRRMRAGVEIFPERAFPYLERAAERGSMENMMRLGLSQYNLRHYDQAFRWFSAAEAAGNNDARYFAGKMLMDGQGTEQNERRGADLILIAAQAGHTNAMYRLAGCYRDGAGVTRSEEQAFAWFVRASGNGNAKASWDVALCYVSGIGTTVDYDQALNYFGRQAMQTGNNTRFVRYINDSIPTSPFATYVQGIKAFDAQDFNLADRYFRTLSRHNAIEAKFWDGMIDIAAENPRRNLNKGIRAIREAAQSLPLAMYIMGTLTEQGEGTEQNTAEAREFYTRAAEAGYGPAECALADIYFEGRGVDQDYTQAVAWYTKARESGQLTPGAAQRLADCYVHGWGGLEADAQRAQAIRNGRYGNDIPALLEGIILQ